MYMIDNKLVRRSAVLMGARASYDEAMSIGAATKTLGFVATHSGDFFEGFSIKRPAAGEGPSQSVMDDGEYGMVIRGVGVGVDGKENGEQVTCQVHITGKGDPGYAATAALLAESALCLAQDTWVQSDIHNTHHEVEMYGVLTPSTAMGTALLRRLNSNDRFTFTLRDDGGNAVSGFPSHQDTEEVHRDRDEVKARL